MNLTRDDFNTARSQEADYWMEPEYDGCAYCDDTGHHSQRACPQCNEENYLQDILREDRQPDTEPAPTRLVDDLDIPY